MPGLARLGPISTVGVLRYDEIGALRSQLARSVGFGKYRRASMSVVSFPSKFWGTEHCRQQVPSAARTAEKTISSNHIDNHVVSARVKHLVMYILYLTHVTLREYPRSREWLPSGGVADWI